MRLLALRKLRSALRGIPAGLAYVVFIALLAELVIFLYVRLIPWPYSLPSYSWANAASSFWVDSDPNFGVWHKPHSTYRHTKSCFTVDYRANDYGARDRERARSAPNPRTVILGDSFIEGFGVTEPERLSNRLEQSTGIEHLNFGTSGGFAPLQYSLLYASLASRFSHDRVVVAILPRNDFTDDHEKYGMNVVRYRPYYQRTESGWEIIYTGDKPGGEVEIDIAKGIAREFTHTYHVARPLKPIITRLLSAFGEGNALPPSKFHHYTDRELEILYLSLDAIRERARAADADVTIVLIPVAEDFLEFDPRQGSPLGETLKRWAALDDRASIVDLLPPMHRNARSEIARYFLACDGHWSPYGNAVAAEILMDRVYHHPPPQPMATPASGPDRTPHDGLPISDSITRDPTQGRDGRSLRTDDRAARLPRELTPGRRTELRAGPSSRRAARRLW